MRWWERFAGRLDYELAEFARLGLEFVLDEAERDHGRIVVRGSVEHEGDRVRLEVVYPDGFPYLRPIVYAPDLDLGRHQNPFEKNLCLLDAPTAEWNPYDTAAWLVGERIPLLLSRGGRRGLARGRGRAGRAD
jgi:hypothetical protein